MPSVLTAARKDAFPTDAFVDVPIDALCASRPERRLPHTSPCKLATDTDFAMAVRLSLFPFVAGDSSAAIVARRLASVRSSTGVLQRRAPFAPVTGIEGRPGFPANSSIGESVNPRSCPAPPCSALREPRIAFTTSTVTPKSVGLSPRELVPPRDGGVRDDGEELRGVRGVTCSSLAARRSRSEGSDFPLAAVVSRPPARSRDPMRGDSAIGVAAMLCRWGLPPVFSE
mmetsp:Transcript_32892/g.92114  ORF Transcript_32892/g.92114 Transcript_32892/m.92114 type:complete len:228 (-) Transcript_32892:272-955(-)